MEPLGDKFRSFGYDVLTMNGHDMMDVLVTITKAKNSRANKPICIIANTVKGKGVSFMEHQLDWHGKAPNEKQCQDAFAEIEGGKK
jgi:transketolase